MAGGGYAALSAAEAWGENIGLRSTACDDRSASLGQWAPAFPGKIEEAMAAESRRYPIAPILRTAPGIGPVRAAQMLPIVITPHRFRLSVLGGLVRDFNAVVGIASGVVDD